MSDFAKKSLSNDDITALIKQHNIKFIKLQFVDINGLAKNMSIPSEHIDRALDNQMMLDGSSIKGFRSIETSDMYLVPDKNTFTILPWRAGNNIQVARLICDIHNADMTPFEGCPRCNLKRVIKKDSDMGYVMNIGPEAEFFLFDKNKEGYVTLNTRDKAGYYDVGPDDSSEDIRREIILILQQMGFDIEASHHENAPGQHEIDFKYSDILTTADNTVTFRQVVKVVAANYGLHATFMPKPIFGKCGSGMHCNISLFKDGKNTFLDESKPHQLSDVALYSIGSIMENVKGFTAVTNPLVNSYKRIVPGFEAPVYMAWSLANRSAVLRVPAKRGNATRVELRSPDPSCNPYLAFAVLLETCLEGIKNKTLPPEAVEANIYNMTKNERAEQKIDSLPGSLIEALNCMEKNEVVKSALGDHIFNEFLWSKKKEWDSFRTSVTMWELDNYLEKY